ncbi:1-aminocyclopropane-1-carboxylate deaminase [Campylobacter sp. VBCF_06 NA8]|uniref:1-aminocyclopropane-1-carboxylate deaminase n=1 Tax=Campylobacter sp. VBCF_06 NA8 TaxID=2983822 RepID=UPI0022E9E4A0|nr:1-aminocyclopropane-1-carboxylate deaminase [Campylobacter sp. VBCF_06 NA8]MDA3046456.1 1-aminocyclopropane-1-carboxylate deaminase [Campylobacter sp. VBCF_06 NA8]
MRQDSFGGAQYSRELTECAIISPEFQANLREVEKAQKTGEISLQPPKIQKIKIENFSFLILRDDLIGIFNGNKARKLQSLLSADLQGISKIVSFGSSQSNAMYNESVFARIKGLKFQFVISHLSENLSARPCGNFAAALENGMEIFVAQNRREFALSLCDESTIFIEEGVAQGEAEAGFIAQAKFIEEYARENGREFDIFLPSGTGTSAAYLAKHSRFRVFTTPCVGDCSYLREQILALDPHSGVQILPSPRKFHFGKPYAELYEIWQKARAQTGIEFDLIYDPVGLLTLLANREKFTNEVLYIHQGGILGNISQLQRYEYKFKRK